MNRKALNLGSAKLLFSIGFETGRGLSASGAIVEIVKYFSSVPGGLDLKSEFFNSLFTYDILKGLGY
jgi:hypothetical protein